MIYKNTPHLLTGILLVIVSVVKAQVSLVEVSLQEQVLNSSLVVEGKVLSNTSYWDAGHKMIYTAHTIDVYKVFKGKPIATVEILTLGGFVGLEGITATHTLELKEGDTGVFMLHDDHTVLSGVRKSNLKQYKAYSGLQGFYAYGKYKDEVANIFSKKKSKKASFYKDICALTHKNYVEIKALETRLVSGLSQKANVALPPSNISFSPREITAGTKSVLTITGSGFGNQKGSVGFREADSGGGNFTNALNSQILDWNNTRIRVEVPDGAGTGDIVVRDANGSGTRSSGALTVLYSQSNPISRDGEAFQVQHHDNNGLGGYTWRLEQRFFNDADNPGARADFERAVRSWSCETEINWEVSSAPSQNTTRTGSDHIVAFDGGNIPELSRSTLGITFSGYTGVNCRSGLVWTVTSLDIIFNRDINWHFGDGNIQRGQIDFETVALHELGHAHQLGHVIDPGNLMHFASVPGVKNRSIDQNSIDCANDVQGRSTTNLICDSDFPLMTAYQGDCSLSVNDITNVDTTEGITVFPIPAQDELFVTNKTFNKLKKVIIYDLRGRTVLQKEVLGATQGVSINVKNVSRGVYILNIETDGQTFSSKLVLN